METKTTDESFIKNVEYAANTGGNVLNDIVTLRNGMVIRISEDSIVIYNSTEDDRDGKYAALVNTVG